METTAKLRDDMFLVQKERPMEPVRSGQTLYCERCKICAAQGKSPVDVCRGDAKCCMFGYLACFEAFRGGVSAMLVTRAFEIEALTLILLIASCPEVLIMRLNAKSRLMR